MLTSTACSWCRASNPTSERYCSGCGHEAHVARSGCRCSRCRMFFGPLQPAVKYGDAGDER